MAVAAAFTLAGCATVINGNTQELTIKSMPDTAAISITNRAGEIVQSGNSPITVKLNRGAGYFKPESYKIRIQKDGYEPRTVMVRGKLSGWYFGNLVLGGVIVGMLIVDPITGAMFTLSPDSVEASLNLMANTSKNTDQTLTVVLVEDVPLEVMKKAHRLN